MNQIYKYLTAFSLLTAIAAGCSKEPASAPQSHEIAFSVRMADMIGTKAATQTGQYTGSNLSSLDWFKVTGYKGSDLMTDVQNRQVFKPVSGDLWQFDGNPKTWPSGQTLTFWASANMPDAWATFATPAETSATLTVSEIPSSATSQCDPLVGYYKGTGNNGKADLKFFHPLTAVKFEAGALGAVTSINSVTLKGVYKGGTATVTGGSPAPTITWSPTGEEINVSGTLALPFILIPQDLSTNPVEMVINVTIGGEPKDIPAALSRNSWESGKIYTYTLNYLSLGITSEGQELGPAFDLSEEIDSYTGKTFGHEWDRN